MQLDWTPLPSLQTWQLSSIFHIQVSLPCLNVTLRYVTNRFMNLSRDRATEQNTLASYTGYDEAVIRVNIENAPLRSQTTDKPQTRGCQHEIVTKTPSQNYLAIPARYGWRYKMADSSSDIEEKPVNIPG